MTDAQARLKALLATTTPELFNAKPHRIAQMLRDGAHAQVPKADNINEVDWDADAAFILAAMNYVRDELSRTPDAQPSSTDEVERLIEALKPFVEKADWADKQIELWGNRWHDGTTMSVSLGSLRKARAAIAAMVTKP